jgi:hypothetical protein
MRWSTCPASAASRKKHERGQSGLDYCFEADQQRCCHHTATRHLGRPVSPELVSRRRSSPSRPPAQVLRIPRAALCRPGRQHRGRRARGSTRPTSRRFSRCWRAARSAAADEQRGRGLKRGDEPGFSASSTSRRQGWRSETQRAAFHNWYSNLRPSGYELGLLGRLDYVGRDFKRFREIELRGDRLESVGHVAPRVAPRTNVRSPSAGLPD